MKKLVLLPFVLLLSFAALAQEKYVEVVVADTLLIEPQEESQLDFDSRSYSTNMNSDKIKLEKSMKVRFAIL